MRWNRVLDLEDLQSVRVVDTPVLALVSGNVCAFDELTGGDFARSTAC